MRASPAFQISLYRFGVWRGAVLGLAALGVSTLAAWVATRDPAIELAPLVAVAAAGALLVWSAATLARVPALDLRWDGALWHLGPPGAPGDDSVPGELVVAIDLGPWMLLRFKPAAPGQRPLVTWLPVQRRGAEAHWHALRCAIHAPRAATDAGASSGR